MLKITSALAAAAMLAAPYNGPDDAARNATTASRVLLEKMGQGRFDISDQIYGPSFVAHGFGRDYNLAEDNASGKQIREAIPDIKVSVLRIVASDDLVAVHWRSEGTNTVKSGMFPGTGRHLQLDGMTFFRFADGRIVEEWTTYDNLGLMQKLGLLPTN